MSDKKTSPQTLKGFRDFLPEEKRRRDFVMENIKETFTVFGFKPLETPTLEYSSLLLGKYGKDADKLVYSFKDRGNRNVSLRYDQTVPTARVLSQYRDKLPKFFRRYQIQNVFRADKPQRGRFREFSQCDADIFNSNSYLADAEILSVFYAIYENLGLKNIKIKYNDRQVLMDSLKPYTTKEVDIFSIIQTIDKLDKLSKDEVINKLEKKGLDKAKATKTIETLEQSQPSKNLMDIIKAAKALGVPDSSLEFSPTLARGLDYYTGLIFEGFIKNYEGGSVGGGGRYDNLIKDLSGIDIKAVGFGLGFDRTVEAANELNLIPKDTSTTKVLVAAFDNPKYLLQVTKALRKAGINSEIYPSKDELQKQLKYASQNNIPFVVIAGPDEEAKKLVTLKSLDQKVTLTLEKVIEKLK